MHLDLSGKRAMVCGSTQGIGKAAAIELASMGASITLIARNEEKLKNVLGELNGTHSQKHDYILVDFSFPQEVKKKAEELVEDPVAADAHITLVLEEDDPDARRRALRPTARRSPTACA